MQRVTRTVGYGLHRVRSDGARSVLVVAGVAAAGLLLAAVLVGSLVAQERALGRAVDELAPSVRTIRAAWFGVPGEGEAYGALDRRVRGALGGDPTPTVLFRESSIGGRFVAFGAVDGLASHVRLTKGRLPRSCTAARCEVLQLRGDGGPPRGFVVVGRGVLRSTALFGDAVPADRNELDRARLAPRLQRSIRYHQPATPPLLLTEGVRAAAALPDLENTYRSYGWVSALHGDDVHPWTVGGLVADAARARAELQAASVGFDVVAPAEELTAARDRTTIGARRLLLLGGEGAALLLAFAGFAATRLRRPSEASDRRLTLLGVPLWQRGLVLATQGLVLAVVGVALAWLVAVIVAAAAVSGSSRSMRSSAPVVSSRPVCSRSLRSPRSSSPSWRACARDGSGRSTSWRSGSWSRSPQPSRAGPRTRTSSCAAAARASCCSRFRSRRRRRRDRRRTAAPHCRPRRGARPARGPARRTIERALGRAPSGLGRGGRRLPHDQRRARALRRRVPCHARAGPSRPGGVRARRRPRAARGPVAARARCARSRRLRGCVRSGATSTRSPLSARPRTSPGFSGVTGVAVLGLEPSLLKKAPDLGAPSTIVGPRLGDRLALRARSSIPGVRLEAAVRRPDGEFERVAPGGRVPRGSTLVGLRILPPPRLQERGADAGRSVTGTIELSPIPGVDYATWLGTGGANYRDGRLAVTLTNAVETWFRPRQALDGRALPAIVSPGLAALADRSGRLGLQIGGHAIAVHVVRTAERFPSTRGDFAVVDRKGIETALNLAEPGSGFPTEVWANASTAVAERDARSALRRAPFDTLVLDSRVEREEALRDDPIARGSLAMLGIAAAAAFLLALFALALTTIADLRDDREALLDLESQGAPPGLLRRLVRTRQLVVGCSGFSGRGRGRAARGDRGRRRRGLGLRDAARAAAHADVRPRRRAVRRARAGTARLGRRVDRHALGVP
jgi:hypothetical protein